VDMHAACGQHSMENSSRHLQNGTARAASVSSHTAMSAARRAVTALADRPATVFPVGETARLPMRASLRRLDGGKVADAGSAVPHRLPS
jgi:hypothetical protein